ncbi:MAG: 3'-5' exonuclease [Gallionella sp.]
MTKPPVPTKPEIALFDPFIGLTLAEIVVPMTTAEFAAARDEIMAAGIVGFDTESKPTFAVGEVSTGPHLVQFALSHKAFLFQLHHEAGLPFLVELLGSASLIKVGFGLKSDRKHIHAKLGVALRAVVDLNAVFRQDGYHKDMGVRAAVGLVLGQRFPKSKSVSTSNWAKAELNPAQLLYAANDAYAALKVLEALNLPLDTLPIMDTYIPSPACA